MKEKKPITLKQRLLITALLIAVIPTIVVGSAAQVLARQTLEREIRLKIEENAYFRAQILDEVFRIRLAALDMASKAPCVFEATEATEFVNVEGNEQVDEFFKSLLFDYGFSYIMLTNKYGDIIITKSNPAWVNSYPRLVINIENDRELYGTEWIVQELGQNAGIFVSAPIHGGSLSGVIPVSTFQAALTTRFEDDNTSMFIINQRNQLQFSDSELAFNPLMALFTDSAVAETPNGIWRNAAGKQFLYSYNDTNFPYAEFHWRVYQIVSFEKAFDSIIVGAITQGILMTLVIAAVIAVSVYTSRMLAEPITKIAAITDEMAQGKIKVFIPSNESTLEIAQLTGAVKKLQSNLMYQITSMSEMAEQIGHTVMNVSASVSELASTTAETTSSITEISATVEEARETSAISASKAQNVSMNAEGVLEIADEGQQATDNAVLGMELIRQEMDSMATRISQLSEQTQSIGSIINSVEDIAEQSNLLAVNAAIEAAKAGEAGAGFAVVAQEVKSLAEQSKSAVERVRGILDDIRKATSAAVLAAERSSKAVEAGAQKTEQVGQTISQLAKGLADSAETSMEISISSQEELSGMNQLVIAIEAIQTASNQNVGATQQIEKAIGSLAQLVQNLDKLVAEFDL
jgi:methyl-accepting chemotaxis protein